MTQQSIITKGRYGVAALLLISTSVAAMAQATPPATDAQVTADTATHMATLTGTGDGTAWFLVDEQNNSIRWHIEYSGLEPTGAAIMCPAGEGATPAANDAMAPTTNLMGAITIVDRAGGAAPAAGGAAPAAGAGAAPAGGATPPAGADAPNAGAGVAAGGNAAGGAAAGGAAAGGNAGAGAAAGGNAGGAAAGGNAAGGAAAGGNAMTPDMTGMVEAVNLLEEGGTMMSPFEGQTADIEDTIFTHIATGACFLELTVASTGEGAAPAGGAMTPATPGNNPARTPAAPATTPAPATPPAPRP